MTLNLPQCWSRCYQVYISSMNLQKNVARHRYYQTPQSRIPNYPLQVYSMAPKSSSEANLFKGRISSGPWPKGYKSPGYGASHYDPKFRLLAFLQCNSSKAKNHNLAL